MKMNVNYNEVAECGDKLYYDINPNTQMDVPSYFYMKLEKYWVEWKESNSKLTFYDYCKDKLEKNYDKRRRD
jgi:hypothetical protein